MTLNDLMAAAHDWAASGAAWRILGAVIIVGTAFGLAQVLRTGIHRLRRLFKDAAPVMYIVEQLGAYAILLVGFVAGANVLGLDLTSLALFGGAVGVGLGLGLQGVVKEFVSGLVLIFDPTVQVGDFIEMDGDLRGEVVEIGPRAVRMRTNDDLSVVIPNSRFMESRIVNWTYNEASRRFHVPFSVAEEADVSLVRDVAVSAAKELSFTLPEEEGRETQVWLTGFAGSGLTFDLVVWPTAESSRHPRTLHAAYTWAVYQALQAAGVRGAQDQMDLRVRGMFGLENGEALRALNLQGADRAPQHERPNPVSNDAAAAVFQEIDQQRRRRAEDDLRREQGAPSTLR